MIALARIRSIEGAAGKDGVNGMRGLDGLDGINGTNGIDGMRGADGMHGEKGLDGLNGVNGEVGPQGEKGEAGMTWRGTYRNDIEYDIGDVVGVSGSAYVCIAPTNQSPPVGFGWELLVSRGAQGVRGIKGDTGSGSAIDLPVSIANGGTGKTTDKEAINALLPSQVGKSGKFLSTEGVNLLWADASIPASPDADSLTGTELAANVVTSSLTSVGTLAAVNTSGVITGTSATASTSSTTGAVILSGGVGIAKDSHINSQRIGVGLLANTTNLAVGANALAATITGGINNTAIGSGCGSNITSGLQNTLLGYAVGTNVTTGEGNCSIGYASLNQNTVGNYNTAMGYGALEDTTGSNNTAVGIAALGNITTGALNTAVGREAGCFQADGTTALTTANNSVYLGRDTRGTQSDSNSVVIGYQAIGLGANTTVIGTSATTSAKIYGSLDVANLTVTNAIAGSVTGNSAGSELKGWFLS